jgi:hypothetical protein
LTFEIQYFKNIVRQLLEVIVAEAKAGTKERTKIAARVLALFFAKIAKLGHSGVHLCQQKFERNFM